MDDVKFKVGVKERRKRAELTLPPLTFHHLDSWRKTLGNDAFLAWQVLYTLADRQAYPETHVIHHFDYTRLAERFGCKKDKALQLIKTLFEYGLIEICEEKNKFGGTTNLYVWCDVPFYSETIYCDLEKRRHWKDRNSEGQKLAAMRKINQKESRSEKPNGSEPFGKIERQPFGKIVREPFGNSECINNTNNNISNYNKSNHSSFHPSVSEGMKEYPPNAGRKEGLNEDGMKNQLINQKQLEEDIEVVKKYFFEKVSEDQDIVPFLQRWVKESNKDTVLYCIDRLLEQEEVKFTIQWLEKAIENPEKYPKKIKYAKKDSGNNKKQVYLRSMYS
ncbi:hypothetical protein [Desulforamulus ruminis]|uniref:Uncharacterized protein n=1 Tax=Desulforamulus ruminis (strain ATCC 23193 / DSM 2154 / NCIMB 8452 / DL) TaxID=696281 RepID=F6DTV3_DESRL|nr:hypothetical protein [Desulforamulus ruminis]AEG58971.1 hypothetical protein Desru_0686 [Desulforamulus ruminis DSM 2154]